MYKIAFIGGSLNSIAGYPHFIASQMDKRFEVVAGVFSTDKSINLKTAKQWNIKKVYEKPFTFLIHDLSKAIPNRESNLNHS